MNEVPLYPHGGVPPFHRKSTCLTQSTLGPYFVQIWSRSTPEYGVNETLVLYEVVSGFGCRGQGVFRVHGLGRGIRGVGFRVWGSTCKVWGPRCKDYGVGFGVQGVGFRV